MHVLLGLLASLALLPSNVANGESPEAFALAYVCEATSLNCDGLPPPRVRYAELRMLRGWDGYYWYESDSSTVWLDVHFEREPWSWQSMVVLIHETAHYVHRHNMVPTSCETEALAFSVMNLFLLETGNYHAARWDWFVSYGCGSS